MWKKQINRLVLLLLIFSLTGCKPISQPFDPVIEFTPAEHHLTNLPSPFPPLTGEEMDSPWGKEWTIGDGFAKELDLYQAITSFKRALFLLPIEEIDRRQQIDYAIIFCYYIAHKYQEVVNSFELSSLTHVNHEFPAFNQLLLMLYDSYREIGQCDKAELIMELIDKCSPETSRDLSLLWTFKEARFDEMPKKVATNPLKTELDDEMSYYFLNAKSPTRARWLNAVLPGAGYYYVGQKKSALTSFLINTLFAAAAYQFFHNGHFAAGLITTSLELGWYIGGINGAGIEAQELNCRLYENVVRNSMTKHNFFPFLMFETSF